MSPKYAPLTSALYKWAAQTGRLAFVCSEDEYNHQLAYVPDSLRKVWEFNKQQRLFTNRVGGQVKVVLPDRIDWMRGVEYTACFVDECAEICQEDKDLLRALVNRKECCPKCGSPEFSSAYVGYIADDKNQRKCSCGHKWNFSCFAVRTV